MFKSFVLSFFIVSVCFIILILGIGIFTVYAGKQFTELLKSVPLEYTLTYSGLITAITYLRRKYK